MKRLILLLLCLAIFVSGCGLNNFDTETSSSQKNTESESSSSQSGENTPILNDYNYLDYLENSVHAEFLNLAGSEENIINIEAIYYSKEYLEECEYNSKENIYFGYTLSELDAQFMGERYFFTTGEDGKTTVKAYETYNDEFDEVVKSMAKSYGVVLLVATVKVAVGVCTGQTVRVVIGLAKDVIVEALKSGAVEGILKGMTKGIQSGDFQESLKEGVLEMHEGLAWGAIVGTILP